MTALDSPDVVWFRSLHYGPVTHVLWWAILPDGRLHVRSELQQMKPLLSTLAQSIRVHTSDLKLKAIRYTAVDRATVSGHADKKSDGETRIDTLRGYGLSVRELSHDPVQGWTRIGELLGLRRDGRPWLSIHPSCELLIRALQNAVSDPSDLEAVQASQHDPPLIALRIGAMSRPAPKPFAMPALPKNAVGHLLEEARKGTSRSGLAWK